MSPGRLQAADGREPLEIELLAREQRVTLEVRDDATEEILESSCFPLQRLAAVRSDASAPEMHLERAKHLGTVSVLAD